MQLSAYLKQVGINVRSARLNAGLRQIDVTEKIGLTYRHYQDIEAGKINVSIGTLCRLAKLYNTDIRDLVEGCNDLSGHLKRVTPPAVTL